MYDFLLKQLAKRRQPVDVIVVGCGFMGFGFISAIRNNANMRIPLIITRDPERTKIFLEENGIRVVLEDNPKKIVSLAEKGYIALSKNLELIKEYENEIVLEMTGTISYGIDVALATFDAKKHLITMNVELQTTVGTELKKIADKSNVVVTDALGDQPGCLSRLVSQAKCMGFKPLVVGNMKRFLDLQATQAGRKGFSKDKGGSLRKNTSFADGTKQCMELNLVANYLGMKILKPGMVGPQINDVMEISKVFENIDIPQEGVVDYVIGSNIFPGIFMIAEHTDPNQKKYLRYLNLGEGPRYLLFEPYHLCHLEVMATIAKVAILGQETINNGLNPTTQTVTMAKFNLKKGQKLDGIGGDLVYGEIYGNENNNNFLPIGLSEGAILKHDIPQSKPITLFDVDLPVNTATTFLKLTPSSFVPEKLKEIITEKA